jgi:DNA-binding NarL/FixJ family response regulator
MEDIRITLIEDHDLTRVGMRTALQQRDGFSVVGESANATDGLKMLETLRPDVAIVDIGLPDMDGIELTRRFKKMQVESEEASTAKTKVLILTLQDNEEVVLAAFAAGADSYCMKDVSLDSLAEALRVTHDGNSWIDPAIARVVLHQAQQASADAQTASEFKTVTINAAEPEYNQIIEAYPLTERELEVLQLIVEGCSNAAIAEKLYITVGTVKTHVRNILNKLCADDRTQAAVRALRAGLVG